MNRFSDNLRKYEKIQEWELANHVSLATSKIAELSQLSQDELDEELHKMACGKGE